MTIRLNKVTRDLNVGITTAVEFLQKKGFTVEANPNTKITDEQFELLKKEFSTDKDLKIKSERFSQERQSKDRNKASVSIDGYRETQEKAKPEEIKTVVPEDARPKFKPVGKIDLDKLNRRPAPAQEKEKEAEKAVEEKKVDNFVKSAEKNEKILRHELENTDPELVVKVETDLSDDLGSYNNADDVQNDMYGRTMINRVMTEKSSDIVIRSLMMMPNGIQKMSNDIEGLVQTSLNLGILNTTEDEVTASFSVRSSVQSEKENLIDQLRCVSVSAGGSLEVQGDYPAWEYRHDSPLRDIMVDVFEEQYGRKPVIQAIHAGVECGLFAGKMPGLDCVSFGPDMKNIHTSRESMDVASVQRTWRYTLGILEKLK